MPNDKSNNNNSNIHKNHRERMRQRIRKSGIDGLQDHEILEYLLYAYIPRKDTNPIAHKLIDLAGSLEGVFTTPVEFLENVPNMTKSAALFLTSLPGVIKRCEEQKDDKQKISVASIGRAKRYFQELLANENTEQLCVALVTSNGYVSEVHNVGSGTTKQCEMDVKKLILRMTGKPEKNVIVAHNHPSGNPSPSMDDFSFTKWLYSFLASIGITLNDHIIVSRGGCFSFCENNILNVYAREYDNYCKTTFADKFPEYAEKFSDSSEGEGED